MGIFKPIWMKKDLDGKKLEKAKAQVEQMTDMELKKVAIEAPDWSVRKAAVEKLTDQKLLSEVAVKSKDGCIASYALEKLTDPTLHYFRLQE